MAGRNKFKFRKRKLKNYLLYSLAQAAGTFASLFIAVFKKFYKMGFFEFVTLTSWIFVINLVVEMLSLSFKTRLGFDYRGTLIALPILFLTDLALIILAFQVRKRGKMSRKLISSILSVVFLVKFVILIMLIVVNGHDLTEHWILIPFELALT